MLIALRNLILRSFRVFISRCLIFFVGTAFSLLVSHIMKGHLVEVEGLFLMRRLLLRLFFFLGHLGSDRVRPLAQESQLAVGLRDILNTLITPRVVAIISHERWAGNRLFCLSIIFSLGRLVDWD